MKKILAGVDRITTKVEYELLDSYIEFLIKEATDKGLLEPEVDDNEYKREIGRLARIGARYENEFMNLSIIKKNTPLILELERKLKDRGLTQKKAAELIGVNEPVLSGIMCGKKPVSMRTAKRLFKEFNIDPKLLIEYS